MAALTALRPRAAEPDCMLPDVGLAHIHFGTGRLGERYAGRPEHEMVADIEQDWGQAVPPEYFSRIRQRIDQAYSTELRAVPGVADVLGRIRIPVFVAHGKQVPGVLTYAAGWMRAPVPNCLVIEDSVFGVRAARAAGMRVFGFTGGSHCLPNHGRRLLDAGAERVIADFRELDAQAPAAFSG